MAYRISNELISDNDNTASPFIGYPVPAAGALNPVIEYSISIQGNVIISRTLSYTPAALVTSIVNVA